MGRMRDKNYLARMSKLDQLDMVAWQRNRPIDRLMRQTNERTSILPTAISYKIVRIERPKDVSPNDPKWLGRDWKYKEVRQTRRISSGFVPDSSVIKNDKTDFVRHNHNKAAMRSRGEIL